MEVIAADKHKLSMEGLLKLEEKMQRIERGLDRDSKELADKFDGASPGSGVPFPLSQLPPSLLNLSRSRAAGTRSR